MSNSYNYNPRPPRVWSRVQNQCTYADASNNVYQSVYIPLTKQTVTLAQANYEDKLLQKGNILQYKGNSSQLTKKQKYSQLAKGFGPNRTKVFATQSETYTNPNTTGLLRVNSSILPFPNDLVGQPNNISGPFQYAVPNPDGCTGLSIQDGGNLVCGTYANPCTGEIIQTGATSSVICNPASASNVPGSATLCWDTKVQTWFPRQRYFMNNSGTKWPQGYKGFVSAIIETTTILSASATCSEIMLSWIGQKLYCGLNEGYNIYVNGKLYATVSRTTTSYEFNEPVGNYSIYITTVSNYGESAPSNVITILILPGGKIIGDANIKATRYENSGYFGVIIETTLPPSINGFGSAIFTICAQVTVSALIIGGGGGGSSGYSTISGGAGGGGEGGGRHARRQQPRRRLRPAGGHPRLRQPWPLSQQDKASAGDRDRRHDQPLPEGVLREGPQDRDRRHAANAVGRPLAPDQVAQLLEQHHGQTRGPAGGLRRGPDAQPQGRSG